MLGHVRLTFETILENLRKSAETGRKSSENHQKRRYKYVYVSMFTLHFHLQPQYKYDLFHINFT